MSRKVLIDLQFLKDLYCGFGQLSLNYGNYIKNNPDKFDGLDITLYVPEKYVGAFGDHVKYLVVSKKYKNLPFLIPHFDVWHMTTQFVRYCELSGNTTRILTYHDLNFIYELASDPNKVRKKIRRTQALFDASDVVTAISNFTTSELHKNLKTKGRDIVLNYVSQKELINDERIKPQFIKSDRKFFFTIGQVREKKNFHVLLDMIKLMPDYDVYICGDRKWEYAEMMQKRIADENITNAFMTEKISPAEKIWLYDNCNAFLFPSKFEGFGLPVIEAMQFGKPVFSSRYTSLPEIGGAYAFFWDNFEPEHMKEVVETNIVKFHSDKEKIVKQIEYALSFTIEKHMGKYIELYKNTPLKKWNPFKTLRNYYLNLKM